MRLIAAAALVALALPLANTPAFAQSPVLRFQVIEADGFTEADPAIADVREALGELFRFRGYRLAAEAVIRVGDGEFSQNIATPGGVTYHINGDHVALIRGDGPQAGQIAIRNLVLWHGSNSPILETSLTVPVGQTVVVGSARPDGNGPTLILVVRTSLQ